MVPVRTLHELAVEAGRALVERGWQVCVAESCTGGGLAEALTSPPGSSAWFDRGYVVYSNRAKTELLGVRERTLATAGAVSEAVVREMAEGALARSACAVALALSGVAGPGGGSEAKPVGTVCMALASPGPPGGGPAVRASTTRYEGDRGEVRDAAVRGALRALLEIAAPAPVSPE